MSWNVIQESPFLQEILDKMLDLISITDILLCVGKKLFVGLILKYLRGRILKK